VHRQALVDVGRRGRLVYTGRVTTRGYLATSTEAERSRGAVPTSPVVVLEGEHASISNRRYGVRLHDGARVECVLYRGDTLCVSTQVGCAVRCPFCASGAQGFGRNLELSELVGQLDAVIALGHRVARITLSGVGEPLHNWDAALELMRVCRARRVAPSLTTSGGPLARLQHALHAPHNGLTISVHAGSEAKRAQLVPHAPSLEALYDVLGRELPTLTNSRRRKTALAYLVMAGENDGDAEVDAFIERTRSLGIPVHLYAYNPVETSAHARLDGARYQAIYARMRGAGLVTRMSSQARLEANGGCGTLVALRAVDRAAPPQSRAS
jgi:23S rRNA (adenine2503-C2)-methyltransferase